MMNGICLSNIDYTSRAFFHGMFWMQRSSRWYRD